MSLLNQFELKKHYNTTLERIKKAEKYYETHKLDEHFEQFLALIKTQNALLEHIEGVTSEEISDGFDLEKENEG